MLAQVFTGLEPVGMNYMIKTFHPVPKLRYSTPRLCHDLGQSLPSLVAIPRTELSYQLPPPLRSDAVTNLRFSGILQETKIQAVYTMLFSWRPRG